MRTPGRSLLMYWWRKKNKIDFSYTGSVCQFTRELQVDSYVVYEDTVYMRSEKYLSSYRKILIRSFVLRGKQYW